MTSKKQKILVGLSGGVDSAVAAYLLKKQGHQVSAGFMKNFSNKVNLKGSCPWKEDKLEAYRVATFLKIPIQTFDFEKEYKDIVVKYLFDSYQKGLTPNPDILCNNEIKFKLFLDKAMALGFDQIATGHYAQIRKDKNGFHLLRGKDTNKDQSYFLAGLNQKQLAKSLFPIGEITKPEVRKLAQKIKLPNANRPDSQGICFIGKVSLKDFLQQKIKPKKGNIVDTKGNVLGQHQGVFYYTIGQRKGIDLGQGGPWYVVKKDVQNNVLTVSNKDQAELFTKQIKVKNWHWINKKYQFPLSAIAQIRYRQEPQKVKIIISSSEVEKSKKIIISSSKSRVSSRDASRNLVLDRLEQEYTATFSKPQKGVAAGQILAVYKKDELVASAIII